MKNLLTLFQELKKQGLKKLLLPGMFLLLSYQMAYAQPISKPKSENKIQQVTGTSKEFLTMQEILYLKKEQNKNNIIYSVNPNYNDLSGQIRFAEEQGLDLKTAFKIASMTAPNYDTQPIGWVKDYTGPPLLLLEIIEKLKNELQNTDLSKLLGPAWNQVRKLEPKLNKDDITSARARLFLDILSKLELETASEESKYKYKGIKGQSAFGKSLKVNNMLKIYSYMKSIEGITDSHEVPSQIKSFISMLTKTWSAFDGTFRQFKKEKLYFLDEQNKIRPEIITTTGLAELAKKHYRGKMEKAYDRGAFFFETYNISMFPLLWFRVEKSSDLFFEEQSRLYNKDGSLKEHYRYHEGQAKYATNWLNKSMRKGYEDGLILMRIPEVSRFVTGMYISYDKVLGPADIMLDLDTIKKGTSVYFHLKYALARHLGWTDMSTGKASPAFQKVRKTFIDENGELKEEWKGITGQIAYAKKYFKGSMKEAYSAKNYVFGEKPVLKEWLYIPSESAKEVEEIIQRFWDSTNQQIKEKYISQEGYLLYAKEHTARDLQKAFEHFTYLSPFIQEKIKWYKYNGFLEDFERDKNLIKEVPSGMQGLSEFASKFYEGSLMRAYQNILAIFQGDEKKLEGKKWFPYYKTEIRGDNTVLEYERDRRILFENGQINLKFKDTKGYIYFSKFYYNEDMLSAFVNIKAVLETTNLSSLIGWKPFFGTVAEFKSIREFLLKSQILNTQSLSEIRPQEIKKLAEQFIQKNNLVFFLKKEVEWQIEDFLKMYKADKTCLSAF